MEFVNRVVGRADVEREAVEWCRSGRTTHLEQFKDYIQSFSLGRLLEQGVYVQVIDREAEDCALNKEQAEIESRETEIAQQLDSLHSGSVAALMALFRLSSVLLLLATDAAVMVLVLGDYLGIDTQRGLFLDPMHGCIALSLGVGVTFLTVLLAESATGAWEDLPPYGARSLTEPSRWLSSVALLAMGFGLAFLRRDQSAGSMVLSLVGILALPVAAALLQRKFGIGMADCSKIWNWLSTRSERHEFRRQARALRRDRLDVVRQRQTLHKQAGEAARSQAVIDKTLTVVGVWAELAYEKAVLSTRSRTAPHTNGSEPIRTHPWPKRFGLT